MKHDQVIQRIKRLFDRKGSSLYGGEAVTQLEHALQAAAMAESSGANAATISAALLHDLGHLLHDLPADAPDAGLDDIHEQLASDWLTKYFGPDVTEPVRMHVAAKRYLCAVDPQYDASLSHPSRQSMHLQGGKFDDAQVCQFEREPFFEQAVQLRRWDDWAKVIGQKTPTLEHFLSYLEQALRSATPAEALP